MNNFLGASGIFQGNYRDVSISGGTTKLENRHGKRGDGRGRIKHRDDRRGKRKKHFSKVYSTKSFPSSVVPRRFHPSLSSGPGFDHGPVGLQYNGILHLRAPDDLWKKTEKKRDLPLIIRGGGRKRLKKSLRGREVC